MERTCKKCGETKPIEEFAKGHNLATCRLCNNVYSRNYYAQNRERLIQTHKKYEQSHRDKIREKNYKYRKEHKEWYKSTCEKYRSRNRTLGILRVRKYRLQHPERITCTNKKRIEELTDSYISTFYKLGVAELRKYSELIELKRTQLKLFRLTKKEKV
jgi:hypothetical protein